MAQSIQVETTVLPGNRIEVFAPELPEGRNATVIILLDEPDIQKRSFWEVVGDYPGRQLFQTAEEVDEYLRAERDSWDS